jgi:peptidyl-prolyl cis-trans isomerase C
MVSSPRRSRAAFAATGLVALFGLSACSTSEVVRAGSSPALEIDGRTILTRDELKAELRRYGSNADFMQGKADAVGADATRFPAALTLDRLNHHLRVEALNATMAELELQPAPLTDAIRTEAAQNIFQAAAPEQGAAAFKLLPKGDQEEYLMLGRQVAAIRQWIEPEAQKVQESLGTAEAYFAANREDFIEACVRHVLVGALAEAEAARARLAAGEPWAEVAKVSTDPGSAQTGGELPCGPVDRYVPEFANAARTLEVNELSEPLRTQFGYHVIQVTKRGPAAFDANLVMTKLQQVAAETVLKRVFQPMEDLEVSVPAEYGVLRSGALADFPAIVASATPRDPFG